MASREPSVSSLADALSRTAAPVPPPRVALTKPTNLIRALLSGVLVMTLLFVAALLVLGARVSTLVADMRIQVRDLRFQETQALPPAAVLADGEATRRETKARPLAAGPIWLARCRHLANQGDWAGIDATCNELARTDPGDLLPATRLLHAQALYRLGRIAEATRVLHTADPLRLDEAGRSQAADLAGTLWMAAAGGAQPPTAAPPSVERPAEQVGQAPAEGAHQLDAR